MGDSLQDLRGDRQGAARFPFRRNAHDIVDFAIAATGADA